MNSNLLLFVIGSSYLPVFSHWFGLRKFLKDFDTAYKGESPEFKFDIYTYILLSNSSGLMNLLITYLRGKYNFKLIPFTLYFR